MPGNQETLRADLRSEILCNAENDPAPQRSPKRSGAANNDRFECEDQLGRTQRRDRMSRAFQGMRRPKQQSPSAIAAAIA